MVDSWQAERLSIFAIQTNDFPLVPGTQTYTLGTGGNFNMARPAKIERISLIWLANPVQPLELPLEVLDYQQWQEGVPVKAVNATLSTKVYSEPTFPLWTLSFWPVPTVVSNIRIYSWNPLTTFPDLVTDVTFPPGYLRAIRFNLAVELAPEFGRPVPPEVMATALQSKSVIKAMNAPAPESKCDPATINARLRVYNWVSDTPISTK